MVIQRFLHTTIGRYLQISVGSLIYALSVSLFLDPNNLAAGGVLGASITISYLTHISTGFLVFLINIPLLIIGTLKFHFKFFFSTIYATVLSSVLMGLTAPLGALTKQPILAALAGGALVAIGIGLVFRAGGTTGGSDILVRLIKLKLRHVKTGQLFLMTDVIVVTAAAAVFGNIDLTLYTVISIVISSIVMDMVLYGRDGAKMIFIIGNKEKEITLRLLQDLEVGATILSGTGAYTGDNKKMILCAVRKQLLPMVQEIVRDEDPSAFMIVTSSNEIYGEGFKNPYDERI